MDSHSCNRRTSMRTRRSGPSPQSKEREPVSSMRRKKRDGDNVTAATSSKGRVSVVKGSLRKSRRGKRVGGVHVESMSGTDSGAGGRPWMNTKVGNTVNEVDEKCVEGMGGYDEQPPLNSFDPEKSEPKNDVLLFGYKQLERAPTDGESRLLEVEREIGYSEIGGIKENACNSFTQEKMLSTDNAEACGLDHVCIQNAARLIVSVMDGCEVSSTLMSGRPLSKTTGEVLLEAGEDIKGESLVTMQPCRGESHCASNNRQNLLTQTVTKPNKVTKTTAPKSAEKRKLRSEGAGGSGQTVQDENQPKKRRSEGLEGNSELNTTTTTKKKKVVIDRKNYGDICNNRNKQDEQLADVYDIRIYRKLKRLNQLLSYDVAKSVNGRTNQKGSVSTTTVETFVVHTCQDETVSGIDKDRTNLETKQLCQMKVGSHIEREIQTTTNTEPKESDTLMQLDEVDKKPNPKIAQLKKSHSLAFPDVEQQQKNERIVVKKAKRMKSSLPSMTKTKDRDIDVANKCFPASSSCGQDENAVGRSSEKQLSATATLPHTNLSHTNFDGSLTTTSSESRMLRSSHVIRDDIVPLASEELVSNKLDNVSRSMSLHGGKNLSNKCASSHCEYERSLHHVHSSNDVCDTNSQRVSNELLKDSLMAQPSFSVSRRKAATPREARTLRRSGRLNTKPTDKCGSASDSVEKCDSCWKSSGIGTQTCLEDDTLEANISDSSNDLVIMNPPTASSSCSDDDDAALQSWKSFNVLHSVPCVATGTVVQRDHELESVSLLTANDNGPEVTVEESEFQCPVHPMKESDKSGVEGNQCVGERNDYKDFVDSKIGEHSVSCLQEKQGCDKSDKPFEKASFLLSDDDESRDRCVSGPAISLSSDMLLGFEHITNVTAKVNEGQLVVGHQPLTHCVAHVNCKKDMHTDQKLTGSEVAVGTVDGSEVAAGQTLRSVCKHADVVTATESSVKSGDAKIINKAKKCQRQGRRDRQAVNNSIGIDQQKITEQKLKKSVNVSCKEARIDSAGRTEELLDLDDMPLIALLAIEKEMDAGHTLHKITHEEHETLTDEKGADRVPNVTERHSNAIDNKVSDGTRNMPKLLVKKVKLVRNWKNKTNKEGLRSGKQKADHQMDSTKEARDQSVSCADEAHFVSDSGQFSVENETLATGKLSVTSDSSVRGGSSADSETAQLIDLNGDQEVLIDPYSTHASTDSVKLSQVFEESVEQSEQASLSELRDECLVGSQSEITNAGVTKPALQYECIDADEDATNCRSESTEEHQSSNRYSDDVVGATKFFKPESTEASHNFMSNGDFVDDNQCDVNAGVDKNVTSHLVTPCRRDVTSDIVAIQHTSYGDGKLDDDDDDRISIHADDDDLNDILPTEKHTRTPPVDYSMESSEPAENASTEELASNEDELHSNTNEHPFHVCDSSATSNTDSFLLQANLDSSQQSTTDVVLPLIVSASSEANDALLLGWANDELQKDATDELSQSNDQTTSNLQDCLPQLSSTSRPPYSPHSVSSTPSSHYLTQLECVGKKFLDSRGFGSRGGLRLLYEESCMLLNSKSHVGRWMRRNRVCKFELLPARCRKNNTPEGCFIQNHYTIEEMADKLGWASILAVFLDEFRDALKKYPKEELDALFIENSTSSHSESRQPPQLADSSLPCLLEKQTDLDCMDTMQHWSFIQDCKMRGIPLNGTDYFQLLEKVYHSPESNVDIGLKCFECLGEFDCQSGYEFGLIICLLCRSKRADEAFEMFEVMVKRNFVSTSESIFQLLEVSLASSDRFVELMEFTLRHSLLDVRISLLLAAFFYQAEDRAAYSDQLWSLVNEIKIKQLILPVFTYIHLIEIFYEIKSVSGIVAVLNCDALTNVMLSLDMELIRGTISLAVEQKMNEATVFLYTSLTPNQQYSLPSNIIEKLFICFCDFNCGQLVDAVSYMIHELSTPWSSGMYVSYIHWLCRSNRSPQAFDCYKEMIQYLNIKGQDAQLVEFIVDSADQLIAQELALHALQIGVKLSAELVNRIMQWCQEQKHFNGLANILLESIKTGIDIKLSCYGDLMDVVVRECCDIGWKIFMVLRKNRTAEQASSFSRLSFRRLIKYLTICVGANSPAWSVAAAIYCDVIDSAESIPSDGREPALRRVMVPALARDPNQCSALFTDFVIMIKTCRQEDDGVIGDYPSYDLWESDNIVLSRIGLELLTVCKHEGLWEEGYRVLFSLHSCRLCYLKAAPFGTEHEEISVCKMGSLAVDICLQVQLPNKAEALRLVLNSTGWACPPDGHFKPEEKQEHTMTLKSVADCALVLNEPALALEAIQKIKDSEGNFISAMCSDLITYGLDIRNDVCLCLEAYNVAEQQNIRLPPVVVSSLVANLASTNRLPLARQVFLFGLSSGALAVHGTRNEPWNVAIQPDFSETVIVFAVERQLSLMAQHKVHRSEQLIIEVPVNDDNGEIANRISNVLSTRMTPPLYATHFPDTKGELVVSRESQTFWFSVHPDAATCWLTGKALFQIPSLMSSPKPVDGKSDESDLVSPTHWDCGASDNPFMSYNQSCEGASTVDDKTPTTASHGGDGSDLPIAKKLMLDKLKMDVSSRVCHHLTPYYNRNQIDSLDSFRHLASKITNRVFENERRFAKRTGQPAEFTEATEREVVARVQKFFKKYHVYKKR